VNYIDAAGIFKSGTSITDLLDSGASEFFAEPDSVMVKYFEFSGMLCRVAGKKKLAHTAESEPCCKNLVSGPVTTIVKTIKGKKNGGRS